MLFSYESLEFACVSYDYSKVRVTLYYWDLAEVSLSDLLGPHVIPDC